MKYFQVKPEFDGQPLFKPSTKGRRIPNGYSLIRYELFTEKEMTRLNIPHEMVREVEASPSNIYHMFGSRKFIQGSLSRN